MPVVWFCWGNFGEPGTKAFVISGIFAMIIFSLLLLLIFYSMLSLALVSKIDWYRTWYASPVYYFSPSTTFLPKFVRRLERRSSRYAVSSGGNSRERTIEVTKQGILYICSWMTISVPMFAHQIGKIFLSGDDFSLIPFANGFYGESSCCTHTRSAYPPSLI